ncbi:MAG: hypothetical protein Q9193_000432 [Seirophora villosa]
MATATTTATAFKLDTPHPAVVTPTVSRGTRCLHDARQHAEQQDEADIITRAFLAGRKHWIEEPVITKWLHPTSSMLSVIAEVSTMYQEWRTCSAGVFCPFSDPLWLYTSTWLRDAGLPWHNNNLNLPDEIDPSWPFHFKEIERQAVLSKGARVGDPSVAGYICDWVEGNLYAIRALQQELRRQRPGQQPLLVGARIEASILESAAQLFGLEMIQLGDHWSPSLLTGNRPDDQPLIFAATLANQEGEADNFAAIKEVSEQIDLCLHIDASRNFDYVTTLSKESRVQRGLPHLVLRHPYLDDATSPADGEDTLSAATMVAAGANWIFPPQVVVLKPHMLGDPSSQVEYVRGNDGTLAGSRDALGPLLVGLQEARFGQAGMRDIFARCSKNRDALFDSLRSRGIACKRPPASLDLVVPLKQELPASFWRKWGCIRRKDGSLLLTVQPSLTAGEVMEFATSLGGERANHFHGPSHIATKQDEYPLDSRVVEELSQRVASWRDAARRSAGYPLSQSLYSALGPVIGHFLPLAIPTQWVKQHGNRILQDRMTSFGITEAERPFFSATFTTGSTMGNRVGLHTALANHPQAFVYYSSSTHYSVKKSVRDSDVLTGRWHTSKKPRSAEIPAEESGRMDTEALVEQALADRKWCDQHGLSYSIVLLANIGTTFVGGCDDILSLRKALRCVGLDTAYVHVDGALNFGFSPCSVRLGSPSLDSRDGVPVVQGVTLSHHKAWGIMVSGEAICYDPKKGQSSTLGPPVQPRIVFETWLAQKFYTPAALEELHSYCLANASLLRRLLQDRGIAVCYNKGSLITVFERLPPWIVEEFHLAPEGQWVHYIAMPHISPEAVVHFVDAVAKWQEHFSAALTHATPEMSCVLKRPVTLQRVRCCDAASFPRTVRFVESATEHDEKQGTDTFESQCRRGASSFAARDCGGVLAAVFLVDAAADKFIQLDNIYLSPAVDSDVRSVRLVAEKGVARYAELAGLTLLC